MRLDPGALRFAQHRATTWELFAPDWLDVPVERFPHYRALKGDTGAFRRYLRASWRGEDTGPGMEYLRKVANERTMKPIEVCARGSGWLVVDGNHRASVAAHRGEAVKAREVGVQEYAERLARTARGRWGAAPGRPYQTIHGEGFRIEGRRDLADRHALIDPADLRGTVLDIGSNIGAASLFAARCGATVTGWDRDWSIVTAAVRFAVLTGLPVTYRVVDVARPPDGAWDTGFCFAVHEHADVLAAISQCRVVYIETHRNAPVPDRLTAGRGDVTLVGRTDGGRRRLYRMERR